MTSLEQALTHPANEMPAVLSDLYPDAIQGHRARAVWRGGDGENVVINEHTLHDFKEGRTWNVWQFLTEAAGWSSEEASRYLLSRAGMDGGSLAAHTTAGRAGDIVPPVLAPPKQPRTRSPEAFKEVDTEVLERHREQASQLSRIPASMTCRGFTLDDLRRLGFAAWGEDAVFPLTGPDGKVLALKRRLAKPLNGQRYLYTTKGHGTPAWCSPDFPERDTVLIVEGELNGMACWLAAPELGVMGIAGTNGKLHQGVLGGRVVYVYADGDEVGRGARAEWAAEALGCPAAEVFVLEPWELDACEMAGKFGRAELRSALTSRRDSAQTFKLIADLPHEHRFDEKGSSSNKNPWLSHKNDLTNSFTTQIGSGWERNTNPWEKTCR